MNDLNQKIEKFVEDSSAKVLIKLLDELKTLNVYLEEKGLNQKSKSSHFIMMEMMIISKILLKNKMMGGQELVDSILQNTKKMMDDLENVLYEQKVH